MINNKSISIAGQNIHWEDKGAFTGEISPLMIKEYGCSYTIIGHSERRIHFKEDDDMINKKVRAAYKHDLIPILCIGETLSQRKEGKAWKVVEKQIKKDIEGLNQEELLKLILAYEPVWAIGTGIAAEPNDAVEIHNRIRDYFANEYNSNIAESIRILYGGSVSSANINNFIKEETIDGALVGGASLKIDEFSAIIYSSKIKIK